MPPVSSAFLLGLPETILAVLALFDDSLLFCWTELEHASIPFCFQPRARVGYATMYFTPLDQSDELLNLTSSLIYLIGQKVFNT